MSIPSPMAFVTCARVVIGMLVVTAIATPALAGGGVRYVDDDAETGGDGVSWATAHRYLQDALSEAAASGGVINEIRMAQGTYRPDQGSDVETLDREAAFDILDDVTLRGGYLGLAAKKGEDPDERDVETYRSILAGDLRGDDGGGFTNRADNSFHVVTAIDLEDTAVLDGVTVRGGHADGPNFGASPESQDQGSAVNVYFASPTFIDCTFEDNWAINHGTLNDHGSTTLIGCTFRDNYADNLGGGLYMHFHAATVVRSCRFLGNAARGPGGGLYNRGSTAATIHDSAFIGNSAGLGGAVYHNALSAASFERCTFRGNTAATGGAMFIDDAEPTLSDCTFEANEAMGGEGGGAIWNQGGRATIVGCHFTANLGVRGGGLYNGNESRSTVAGCTFMDNVSLDDGGGLSNDSSTTTVSDCVFIGNGCAGGSFVTGGGMSNYFSTTTVTRCMFIGNTAFTGVFIGGGGVYFEAERDGTSRLTGCVFAGNRSEVGGGLYNFRASPVVTGCLFVDNAAEGDFFAVGGGVYGNFQSSPELINCTFTGNVAIDGGGALYDFAGAPRLANCILWGNAPDEIGEDGSSVTVDYSTVRGGWSGAGVHNLDADPSFVDAGNDDYSLAAGSPCIDAGHNWRLPPDLDDLDADGDRGELMPHDLDGAPRIADHVGTDPTGCGAGVFVVDMGSYEASGVPLDPATAADLDGSGVVDFADVLIALSTWGPCVADCCPADLDASGSVGFGDVLAILASWGA